jgi:protease IV
LVVEHRQISPEAVKDVSTARIYLAQEALTLGLIDEIGYISDAISRTKEIADLDANSEVIVYRRVEYPNDNLYNTQAKVGNMKSSLIDLGLPDTDFLNRAGFYYLWPSGVDKY